VSSFALAWLQSRSCPIGKYDEHYEQFNPRAFMKMRCPGTEFDTVDRRIQSQWKLTKLHNFYEDFHKEWDTSKAKFLEFAAGPYLHTLISAAPFVAEIYHSDYLPACREEVLMWMRKDPNAYNWDPYFKYVVNTLEAQKGEQAIVKRQELLRNKFKGSLYLNMKSDNMLPNHNGKFDVIFSGYCIEYLASSLEEYKTFMRKVFSLLKPNGYFVMLTSMGATEYYVDDVKYPCYPLRINDVLTTLEEIGYTTWFSEIVRIRQEEGIKYPSDQVWNSCYVTQKI